MKNFFLHTDSSDDSKLWRTDQEKNKSSHFKESLTSEFESESLPTEQGDESSGLSRRDFIRLASVTAGLMGVNLVSCRRSESLLVPFSHAPEWNIPGKFLYYATTRPSAQGSVPLVVTTTDGRPIKIEGNPLHPDSRGSSDLFSQASILDLYDPYRSKEIFYGKKVVNREDFNKHLADIRQKFLMSSGDGLAIMIGKEKSPTIFRLKEIIKKQFPKIVWIENEAIDREEQLMAWQNIFGNGVHLSFDFLKADIVLSLGSDFLNPTGYYSSFDFIARRKPDAKMNRLYVIENHFSLTGGMADHRIALPANHIESATLLLAKKIFKHTNDPILKDVLDSYNKVFDQTIDNEEWISGLAEDLLSAYGKSIIIVGEQQPQAVHILATVINEVLGNHGQTILSYHDADTEISASLQYLSEVVSNKKIDTLLIFEGNPVYTASANINFINLLSKIRETVHVSLFFDETSAHTSWHIPATHYLERWGDVRSKDGTISSIQPMIDPLWNGISTIEILSQLAGELSDSRSSVQKTFDSYHDKFPNTSWEEFLKKGFIEGSAWKLETPIVNKNLAVQLLHQFYLVHEEKLPNTFEVVFIRSNSVDDGRYAHNSWLQETPDFVTKLVWDNAAIMSPEDAFNLKVSTGDFIKLTSNEQSLEIAIYVLPGHAQRSITISLGYGRSAFNHDHLFMNVGFNAYSLKDMPSISFLTNVYVERLSREPYLFASTQEHNNMEGRNIAREGTLDQLHHNPYFASQMDGEDSIPDYSSVSSDHLKQNSLQWGMSIDLNSCIGCNACLVACRSENNVPIVGKAQIRKGRDMAWIRIDRWFATSHKFSESVEMIPMPILCQQCEDAPCESVCPATATIHNEEGLNIMAYNRCIGTRYCANNCPWKVRRFNYFNYNERPLDKLYEGPLADKGMPDSLQLLKNPNVSVRMRGVMEKCSFCIQRIEEAKIARAITTKDSHLAEFSLPYFQTACQQACPSESIVFGNLSEKDSLVAQLKRNSRTYTSLSYLQTRPRVTYMARIKNPNPLMPDAQWVGTANIPD